MTYTKLPPMPVPLTPAQSEALEYIEDYGPISEPRGVSIMDIIMHMRGVFPDITLSEIEAAVRRLYDLGLIEKLKVAEYPEWRYEVPLW